MRVHQLRDMVGSRGIERCLYEGLIRTAGTTEGFLKRRIWLYAGIEFAQPLPTREDGDQGIQQFLGRSVAHFLLRDGYALGERFQKVELL